MKVYPTAKHTHVTENLFPTNISENKVLEVLLVNDIDQVFFSLKKTLYIYIVLLATYLLNERTIRKTRIYLWTFILFIYNSNNYFELK